MKIQLIAIAVAGVVAAFPGGSQAGTVTFAEFDGLPNNAVIPSPPQGLPAGVTATWTGFLLHTTAGDTPMSVFVDSDRANADDATIRFSSQVVLSSINVYDTSWGTDPVIITGRRAGTNVWVYTSPGNHAFEKVTVGAGQPIDTLAFEGRWNHYDDLVVDVPFADADGDGLNDYWEYTYFPGDLTKLTANGDFDHDGLKDSEEAAKGTDPTKADTDGDGLSDKVETDTGHFTSLTDTGTSPLKADTDGDGRKDGDEINGTPATDPFNPDSDMDTYLDGDEVATGHDPNNAADNPEASAIANSITQFSGIQGQDGWYYGYRNLTKDGGGDNYNPVTGFIEFAPENWNGGSWAPGGNPPWTSISQKDIHPNAGTGDIHWPIRRWVASQLTTVTPLAIRWHTHHQNVACGGNGVTGALYLNGQLLDRAVIAAPDNVGVTHTYYLNASPGDRIDLVLSAKGTDGREVDGCDGSQNWLLVDPTIPAEPRQPDGSLFVPVGAGDSDGDGLPDVWEKMYFPNDLTKLSKTGDYDQDGLSDLAEYQRGSDPTKADTDGDGLSDLVETGTGIYVSKTDTGTNPAKADTDGDGLSDATEVNRTPATNPNKADTDGDGYSDPDEITWGTDPTSAQDTPLTYVIANSQADFSGVQGQKGWYNGYRIFDPTGGTVNYNPNQDFIPFVGGEGQGDWNGVNQFWSNGQWSLNPAGNDAPWLYMGRVGLHPNGTNNTMVIGGEPDPTKELWPIRRWSAQKLTNETPVTIIWQVKKTNLNNDGVTGMLFINGKLVDSKAIAGDDGTGEVRRYHTSLKSTDLVDLALSPAGPSGDRLDYSDGSEDWFWVDARPVPATVQIASTRLDTVQGKCLFQWNSQPGARYHVLISSNLKDWTVLQTVDSGGAETSFTDTLPAPQPAARFYRIQQQ